MATSTPTGDFTLRETSSDSTQRDAGLSSKSGHTQIILYWSSEDDAFIAEVPELPSCVTDGATRQEALANVDVVIAEWRETAHDRGRSIPEPKGRLLFA